MRKSAVIKVEYGKGYIFYTDKTPLFNSSAPSNFKQKQRSTPDLEQSRASRLFNLLGQTSPIETPGPPEHALSTLHSSPSKRMASPPTWMASPPTRFYETAFTDGIPSTPTLCTYSFPARVCIGLDIRTVFWAEDQRTRLNIRACSCPHTGETEHPICAAEGSIKQPTPHMHRIGTGALLSPGKAASFQMEHPTA